MKTNRREPTKKTTTKMNTSIQTRLSPVLNQLASKSQTLHAEYSSLLNVLQSTELHEASLLSASNLLSHKATELEAQRSALKHSQYRSDFAVVFELLLQELKQAEGTLNAKLEEMNLREKALLRKDFLIGRLRRDSGQANSPSQRPRSVFWEILQEEMSFTRQRPRNPRVVHRIKVKMPRFSRNCIDANVRFLLCRVAQLTLLPRRVSRNVMCQLSQAKPRKPVEELKPQAEVWRGSFGRQTGRNVCEIQEGFSLSSFMVKSFKAKELENKEEGALRPVEKEPVKNPFEVVSSQKDEIPSRKSINKEINDSESKDSKELRFVSKPFELLEVNPDSLEFKLVKRLIDKTLNKTVLNVVKKNKLREIEQKLQEKAIQELELKAYQNRNAKPVEFKAPSTVQADNTLEEAILKESSLKAIKEPDKRLESPKPIGKETNPFISNTNSNPPDDLNSQYSRNLDGLRVVELSDSMEGEEDRRVNMDAYLDMAQRMKNMAQESKEIESSMKALTGSIKQKTLNSSD